MPEKTNLEKRLGAIEAKLTDLHKLLVSTNQVPSEEGISALARKVANGDYSALKAQNKSRLLQRRPH